MVLMSLSEQEEEYFETEEAASPGEAGSIEEEVLDAPAVDSLGEDESVEKVMDTTEVEDQVERDTDSLEGDEPATADPEGEAGEELIVPVLDSLEEFQISEEGIDQEGDGRAWYVVHCYSGYENKVRHNLEQRIESMGMKDKIFDIVVPTEEEIEVKEGKRRTVERRVFPGYILVNMILSEESWYVVRNTPGVTGFVGMGNTPTPLRPEEVSQIIRRMEAEAPRIKVTFKSGERVRIVDGPFNDFRGTVSEIDMERAKVRVMVNFFGRETPVELDFLQVEKT
jgi:transcriptional antiterminator NusG